MNKRGNVFDAMHIGIALLVLFLFIIVALIIIGAFNTAFQNATLSQTSKDASTSIATRAPSWFDGGFIVVYIGLIIAAIIGAYMIETSKIFFVFSIIVLGIILVISIGISNIYDSLANNPTINPYLASIPITSFLMNNYAIQILIIGFAILIALFGKPTGGGNFA